MYDRRTDWPFPPMQLHKLLILEVIWEINMYVVLVMDDAWVGYNDIIIISLSVVVVWLSHQNYDRHWMTGVHIRDTEKSYPS